MSTEQRYCMYAALQPSQKVLTHIKFFHFNCGGENKAHVLHKKTAMATDEKNKSIYGSAGDNTKKEK